MYPQIARALALAAFSLALTTLAILTCKNMMSGRRRTHASSVDTEIEHSQRTTRIPEKHYVEHEYLEVSYDTDNRTMSYVPWLHNR